MIVSAGAGRGSTLNLDHTLDQISTSGRGGHAKKVDTLDSNFTVGLPELCSAVCTEICGKRSRFSVEFAKVSLHFDAVFAQHTRPVPAKNAQKSQACVTRCAVHVR